MKNITEIETNILSEGTKIEGQVVFDHVTRVHGTLVGNVLALDGSTLIISESGVIEGNVNADTLIVDGYIEGDIVAKKKTLISGTGRVIGNIQTPSLLVEFGAFFEGKCTMEKVPEPLDV